MLIACEEMQLTEFIAIMKTWGQGASAESSFMYIYLFLDERPLIQTTIHQKVTLVAIILFIQYGDTFCISALYIVAAPSKLVSLTTK